VLTAAGQTFDKHRVNGDNFVINHLYIFYNYNIIFNYLNPLTPELNPSAQRCLLRFLMGILIFKGLTTRRRYKSFGVKRLALGVVLLILMWCWYR
jgi:hypothetical protein